MHYVTKHKNANEALTAVHDAHELAGFAVKMEVEVHVEGVGEDI